MQIDKALPKEYFICTLNSASKFKYLSTKVAFEYDDLRTENNMHRHKTKSIQV